MATLAERLELARRQQFIGRNPELEIFEDALAAPELPFAVLYLYGPGGVGKTTLLRAYAQSAQELGYQVCQLDGRSIEASPEYFRNALHEQLRPGASNDQDGQESGCRVLLIDTAELLAPLEGWLSDTFLPALPDNCLTVFAGRNPPSHRWLSDPGWHELLRLMPLKNFNQQESLTYLQQRQIPESEYGPILAFTYGHPLALSLVADVYTQKPKSALKPQNEPDIIKVLVERFTQEAPTSFHRAALEASSQVLLLNEPLLAAMVQVEDPYPLLHWLRGLSFFDANEYGLFPHDLAREALSADLRWRNPQWQATLHDRARKSYMSQFLAGSERRQRRVLNEYVYLHRDNPLIKPFFEWQSSGVVYTEIAQPADEEELLQIVRAHEGERSAGIAAHWLGKPQTQNFVLRHSSEKAQGLLTFVDLSQISAAELALDPAVKAATSFLQQNAPLRLGEKATIFRFWMDRDSYQEVSPTQSRIFLNMVQHYLTTPGLAYSFIPCVNPDFWQGMFAFADLQRLPAADFTVDGRSYGVYGHDWRAVPPLAWLEVLASRELDLQNEAARAAESQPVVILDETAFKGAVRKALNDYTDILDLQKNPLLQTRMMLNEAGLAGDLLQRVERLRSLLVATADTLQNNPRQQKWYRVLVHTYFQPAGTQEAAAELLDLPFSTYRRHLQAGVQQVSELLWRREIGSAQ